MATNVTASTEEEIKEASILMLETMLRRVRSGEVILRSVNQIRKSVQVYDNETEKWEYFRIGGGTVGWIYETPLAEKTERERLTQYLLDHPKAEVVPETESKIKGWNSVPNIEQRDTIWVYLDGLPLGYVIEADAVQGYVVQYAKVDGTFVRVTRKGVVRIEFNGTEVPRVETEEGKKTGSG